MRRREELEVCLTAGYPGLGPASSWKGIWVSPGLSGSNWVQGQRWLAEERRGGEGRKGESRDKIGRNREDEGAALSPGAPGRLSQSPTQ